MLAPILAVALLLASPGTRPEPVLVGIMILGYLVMRALYPRPA